MDSSSVFMHSLSQHEGAVWLCVWTGLTTRWLTRWFGRHLQIKTFILLYCVWMCEHDSVCRSGSPPWVSASWVDWRRVAAFWPPQWWFGSPLHPEHSTSSSESAPPGQPSYTGYSGHRGTRSERHRSTWGPQTWGGLCERINTSSHTFSPKHSF